MSWAMDRVKKQYRVVEGLQHTTLGRGRATASGTFKAISPTAPLAVQIVHMPSHWGWVAQFEGKIFYGDSLNMRDGRVAPPEVLQQMAALFPHHIKSSTLFTLPYTSVVVDQ